MSKLMPDYKHTLNLPHTTFSMKANLPVHEPKRLAAWENDDLYAQIRLAFNQKPTFILHDGPPYANGHLHCGHALNKILKDIIIKSKTLSGFNAPFIPGWDCHGLPIELNVEKKVGKVGVKITASDFRQHCRDYATSQINIQRQEFKRLGILGDWQHAYATYDYAYEANIIRALAKIIANGHLEQGFKPVHWCIDCRSALAEAEVDYEHKLSDAIDVAFYAQSPHLLINQFSSTLLIKPVIVPIWTTTPWSLPGNEAVCLHPETSYQLVDAGDHYFVIAAALVKDVMTRYAVNNYQIIASTLGQALVHLQLKHPIENRIVPIILGSHVTTDTGTGCVHTAPAHGLDDYYVGKAFDLPLKNPVMGNGCYSAEVPYFAHQSVTKVNQHIIAHLEHSNRLLKHCQVDHSYPHCWRHKTPVIFLATPQWFIAMDKNGLRQAILATVDDVHWLPDWGKQRIYNMINTRPDWCISRQRAWGTPMPLFIHKTTRELHPNTNHLLKTIAALVAEQGIEAWFNLQTTDLLGTEAAEYDKVTDTLDVWFDSGVSHYAILTDHPELQMPADVYFEGSDQHRGWFNSSLTTAVAISGVAPYKTVLTHGYTVDTDGRKLSKSQGNYVELDKIIHDHGADVLRLWVSSTDYRNEVSISTEILKRSADAYRRIRNTSRFLLANLVDFIPKQHLVLADDLVAIDAWAIARARLLQAEIIDHYNRYQFHIIYQKIHHFCTMDLGSFYLDVIKDRQYTMPCASTARRSCQTAMYHIIHALTRWLAPIISFTAEEIWQAIPGEVKPSLFLQCWYNDWPDMPNIDMNYWQRLSLIRDEVNKALEIQRQAGVIGSALAAEVTLYVEPKSYAELKPLAQELRFLFITSKVTLKPWIEKTTDVTVVDELGMAVEITASIHQKCARCWHRCAEVGQLVDYEDICQRCVDNITTHPEKRYFV